MKTYERNDRMKAAIVINKYCVYKFIVTSCCSPANTTEDEINNWISSDWITRTPPCLAPIHIFIGQVLFGRVKSLLAFAITTICLPKLGMLFPV